MKKLDNQNLNTKTYWNICYGDPQKRAEYANQGTDSVNLVGNMYIQPTMRFQRACEEIENGQKVIDFGCGVGVFTKLCKTIHPDCEVYGTDISDQAMKDNTIERPDITYLHQYVGHQDQVPSDYFDVVFSGEVLEHLDNPEDLFKDAFKALKIGGKFIVTTPREDAIHSDEHLWEFNQEDIEKLFKDNGFDRIRFIYLPDMEHIHVIMAVGIKK